MLKYVKFGFGKVTEQVSGAIRNGMMSREEALELVRRYDGKVGDRIINNFCNYLGISEEEALGGRGALPRLGPVRTRRQSLAAENPPY